MNEFYAEHAYLFSKLTKTKPMTFDHAEILEILEKIGYEIKQDNEDIISRRAKIFAKRSGEYILYNGEKMKPEEVFKIELKKRIFNLH